MDTKDFTRRTFIAGVGATVAASLVKPAWSQTAGGSLGEWRDGSHGLPCYAYHGPIRFVSRYSKAPMFGLDGKMLPDDPVFLLGNYRLTLFTHASGLMQILTGERAWGRMNDGGGYWSGANKATCIVDGSRHELVGLDEPAAKEAGKLFGVGFARYSYQLGKGLKVQRSLHVRPSTKPGEGSSAFLVCVRLENASDDTLNVKYVESVLANYRMLHWGAGGRSAPEYAAMPAERVGANALCAGFAVHPRHPLTFPP
ncbi:MAG: hypothetical protein ACREBW_08860, partial [Candidatus Micrarchaeaceae archaeon]